MAKAAQRVRFLSNSRAKPTMFCLLINRTPIFLFILGVFSLLLISRPRVFAKALAFLVLAVLLVYVVKYAVKESRPSGEGYAFPSTHMTLSFFLALILLYELPTFGFFALIFSLLTAWCRVSCGFHYWHDLAGSLPLAFLLASSFLGISPVLREL